MNKLLTKIISLADDNSRGWENSRVIMFLVMVMTKNTFIKLRSFLTLMVMMITLVIMMLLIMISVIMMVMTMIFVTMMLFMMIFIGDNDGDDDNCSSWGNDPEMEAASKYHAFCESKPSPTLRWTLLLWKWALRWALQPWTLLRRTRQSMNFEMSVAKNQHNPVD